MNWIVFDKHEINSNQSQFEIPCDDFRAQHLLKVLQLKVGDCARASLMSVGQGRLQLLSIQSQALLVNFERLSAVSTESSRFHVIMALPRPKVFRRILRHLLILGIKEISFIQTYKVEKSYWQSQFLKEDQLRKQILSAYEFNGDWQLPSLHFYKRFKPFVEDVFSHLNAEQTFLLHPDNSSQHLQKLKPLPGPKSIVLFGPEGGWTPYEIGILERSRPLIRAHLGNRVLNSELAVLVALGILSHT